MLFIVLARFRRKPAKELLAQADKLLAEMEREGVKALAGYWTLGRYDAVRIVEAPNEAAMMKASIRLSDIVSTETLVALKREDALRLVE